MSKANKEQIRSPKAESGGQGQLRRETLEGLPLESSPYVKYHDLEDYKRQGYGTQGHQQVQVKQTASGSTDAPTLSGTTFSDAGISFPDSKST